MREGRIKRGTRTAIRPKEVKEGEKVEGWEGERKEGRRQLSSYLPVPYACWCHAWRRTRPAVDIGGNTLR